MKVSNSTNLDTTSLVSVKNGIIIADSLSIAEKFGKNHRDVIEKVRQVIEEYPENGERNFTLTSYRDIQGKIRPMYEMTRDGFSFLVMGFTGKKSGEWKWKYIEAFNAMETALKETRNTIAPYIKHTRRDVQISNSKSVNAVLNESGGKSAIIVYNTINCKVQSGKTPKQWKKIAQADCLPVKVSRSAKEVLRVKAPPVACGMSLADQLVASGGNMADSISIGKGAQVTFQRILALGLTPSELLM